MATDYCKYHPLTVASWHCPSCHISVCDECTHLPGEAETTPYCLLCNHALVLLQGQNAISPFWLHYTDFMRLPFTLSGSLGLLLMMLLPMLTPDNLFLPVAGVSFFLLMLYGWCLLQYGATGELKDPTLALLLKSVNRQACEVSLVLTAAVLGLGLLAQKIFLLAVLLTLAGIILLPLLLMAVALERSISVLWQVRVWQDILREVRFLYLPLLGASMVLFVMAYALVHLLADVLSPNIIQGLKNGFYGYGLWVMMAISGYTLYQFQKPLHFEVAGKKTKKRVVSRKLDYQTNRLEVYLKEGLYERAAALLKSLAEKQKKNPEIQERYYQLLVLMQDRDQIPYQASNYLEALLETGQTPQAMQVLVKLHYLIPDFRPQSPDLCFDLAKLCVEQQDYPRAVRLLRKMHQDYPNYANLPEAYLLLAKLLNDKLGENHEALEILEYLVLRFKKHPRFEFIQDYWRSLGGKPKEDFML